MQPPRQDTMDPPVQPVFVRGASGRDRLARYVVIGSFLTIFLLCSIMVALRKDPGAASIIKDAFNVILPVLAGWVGTVLACYFSSVNFEGATRTIADAIRNPSGGPSESGTTVDRAMIPIWFIKELIRLEESPPASLSMQDLRKKFESPAGGGKVTRLVAVGNKKFKCIIHKSALNAFCVKSNNQEASLADLLKDPELGSQITDLVVFVRPTATLTEAKTELQQLRGAQDIIVTDTGDRSGDMLGWVSNVDLMKALTR